MTSIRINKYLSSTGICSRRKADEHILNGNVKINGVQAKIGDRVVDSDKIEFCGKIVNTKPDTLIYVLNKPRGYISTAADEKSRKTILDLVPNTPRVFPVGRLDKESQGLIFLTTDGDLAYRLSHPKFEHEKEYQVVGICRGNIDDSKLCQRLSAGIRSEGKLLKAKSVRLIKIDGNRVVFNIILTTGYNRQIRKMCDKIGIEVKKLERIRVGKILLNHLALKPGEHRLVFENQII
jgi:pseudouridine synthase